MKNRISQIGFIAGAFSVVCQWVLSLEKASGNGISMFDQSVRYFSYMTVWTNIFITLCFASVSFFDNSSRLQFFKKTTVQTGALVYILIVGVAYHFLLSSTFQPTGLEWFANLLLHYINPVLFLVFWLLVSEKVALPYPYAVRWMIFPVIYFFYSLIRGFITDWYPYFFVDVTKLGYPQVLLTSLVLLAGYLLVGALIIFIGQKRAVKE